jgi:cobalt-zinc-cadmium efflux system protein
MAHAHHHHGHAHPTIESGSGDKRYAIGIALNLSFVAIEGIAGFLANSTALLADAGHNLSDVLGLALAGGAAWLARRQGSAQRTYGFGKATILAALANAIILVFACGAIGWEAVRRFAAPQAVEPGLIMAVAAAGVVVNTATALMFMRGREHDANVRGAFLHMAADAAVSAGVIVAGLIIAFTGWTILDPIASLAIVVLILLGTMGLLRESLNLAMDTAPDHVDVAAVRRSLLDLPGVAAVHDLHVWAMSTTENALTAHIVRPEGGDDNFTRDAIAMLQERFGIGHVTIQVEREGAVDCPAH